jgi:hypothetical protein
MALFLTSGPKSGSFVSMCCNFQQHRSSFFLLLMIGFAMQNIEVTVEFVIQILKKATKLASEAEARRREAWAGRLGT